MKLLLSTAKVFLFFALITLIMAIFLYVQYECFGKNSDAMSILFAELSCIFALAGIYCGVNSLKNK